MLVLIAYKASAHDCFMSPQVSLQNSTGQLTIVEFGTDTVISLPPWCKHIAALTGWMVQRRKGMKQVALGCPKPVGEGTFYATRQVLSLMAAEEFGESFQLAVFEMGMVPPIT